MGRRAHPPARIDAATRAVVAILLKRGSPSLGEVAAAEGLGPRTLQRRLAAFGTSFSAVVQDVRKEETLRRLAEDADLGRLARDLGYTRPSTLTRAVRRWTGCPPSHLRPGNADPALASAPDPGTSGVETDDD